jgi:hypothetical protein
MENCSTVKTPQAPNVDLRKSLSDEERIDQRNYQVLIGSLMYLAIFTRPDIAYAVSAFGQFSSDPSARHIKAGKHVMRYLKGKKAGE